jgi:hypothetical protein
MLPGNKVITVARNLLFNIDEGLQMFPKGTWA